MVETTLELGDIFATKGTGIAGWAVRALRTPSNGSLSPRLHLLQAARRGLCSIRKPGARGHAALHSPRSTHGLLVELVERAWLLSCRLTASA